MDEAVSLGRLTGAVGMFLEALAIGDQHRSEIVSLVVINQTAAIARVPEFRTIAVSLKYLLVRVVFNSRPPYNTSDAKRDSLPESWVANQRFRHLYDCSTIVESLKASATITALPYISARKLIRVASRIRYRRHEYRYVNAYGRDVRYAVYGKM